MGVVRYLCITILLACLVAAQDCNSVGWLNNHNECVCESGYAGPACETNFAFDPVYGCNINAANALNRKDDRFPVLDDVVDTITFRNNLLKLAIASEIVPKRVYNNITFIQNGATPISDQCKLSSSSSAGSFWAQRNQTTSGKCRDSFVLHMPWNRWSDCGFGLSSSESVTYWVYRATFVVTYTDDLGTPFDYDDVAYKPELYRHSSVAYKIYVRFLKSVEIEIQNVIVNSTVGLQTVITKFEYEPSTQNLTFGISTVVFWPSKLLRDTMTLTITNAATSSFSFDTTQGQVGHPTQDASADELTKYCPPEKYNNCLQYFEFVIHLDSGCDFNAVYIATATVSTCRDSPLDCTTAVTQSFITVSKSDVCGHVTAEPIITGKLMSFDDQHNVKTEFELGYRGYFEVDMQSQNDFNLTWIDIWVVADKDVPDPSQIDSVTLPTIQWLYRNGVTQVNGFHKFNGVDFADGYFPTSPVGLNVHDVSKNANSQTVFTPKFDFLFDAQIFHLPLSVTEEVKRGYTLHAKGKIVYAGNEQYGKKRAEEIVDFVWKTDASGLDATVRFDLAKKGSSSNVQGVSSNANVALLTSLVPVAGIALVVVAAALVAALVIIKRKKSTSFATLN